MAAMTEENDKMSSHDAPSGESFADRFQRLASFTDAHCSDGELLKLLVTAIREQQAALVALCGPTPAGMQPETTRWETARAVLEKWRIE